MLEKNEKKEINIMQPIFTMQYGEYVVADYLRKHLKNVSVFIPTSSQEKGIDLLMYKFTKNTHKALTVQVKMSRTYTNDKKEMPYGLWFNRFDTHENADWFMLVGIYCINKKILKASNTKWGTIILAFKNKEMNKFLNKVRQKKDNSKLDKMFGLRFDDNKNIVLSRGSQKLKDMSKYRIENRIDEIVKNFK